MEGGNIPTNSTDKLVLGGPILPRNVPTEELFSLATFYVGRYIRRPRPVRPDSPECVGMYRHSIPFHS